MKNKNKKKKFITVDATVVEQVKKYEYLGVTLNELGKTEIELNTRIRKVNNTFHKTTTLNKGFMNKTEISKEIKIKVFKSVFCAILS